MNIYHGDNQVASRELLTAAKQEARQQGQQVIELAADAGLDQLVAAVESDSLFGGSTLVVIENLFSARPSAARKALLDYLTPRPAAAVVIWEGKDVSTKLGEFDPQIVRRFDLPKYVFKFLDNLTPVSLNLALETTPPEQILVLLAGQVRKLILAKEKMVSLPSWQMAKIKVQLAKFSLEQLVLMQRRLLELEYGGKTARLPYDLATALQLWVIRYG